MELELYEINVTLSKNQKQKIRNAFINREKIILRLSKDALRGSDTLLVPTSFFGKRDADDENGFYAIVDEQTEKEMRDEIREDLKRFGDESLSYKQFKILKSLRDQNLSDEMLELEIYHKVSEYYGLFFDLAIDDSKGKKNMEDKGLEEIRKKLESLKGEIRKESESSTDEMREEILKEAESSTDEMLEARINQQRETNEHKGIEFVLNYSLVNDLAKDFVKDNIKKLFE